MLFANLVFHPASIAAWLAVGLAAGWLAGKVMESPSYGTIGDLSLGAIGAAVCGASFGLFVDGEPSFWFALVTAIVGACVFIGVARAVTALVSA
jgi:uncharacterized membrane protein YeaQ/YmgE (transglycosylase-associated protein family)